MTLLQISTCADLTSSSCELTADGVGSLQNFTQLSDTSYEIGVQVHPAQSALLSLGLCGHFGCTAFYTPLDASSSVPIKTANLQALIKLCNALHAAHIWECLQKKLMQMEYKGQVL